MKSRILVTIKCVLILTPGNDGAGSTPKTAKSSIEPEVLVLNVRTPEGEPISGAALLPMLTQMAKGQCCLALLTCLSLGFSILIT